MKRPALLVLLLTFVALVAATLWVPVRAIAPGGNGFWDHLPHPDYLRIDEVFTWTEDLKIGVLWDQYLIPIGLIAAVGGLLALALHLRSRRREALTA